MSMTHRNLVGEADRHRPGVQQLDEGQAVARTDEGGAHPKVLHDSGTFSGTLAMTLPAEAVGPGLILGALLIEQRESWRCRGTNENLAGLVSTSALQLLRFADDTYATLRADARQEESKKQHAKITTTEEMMRSRPTATEL